MRKNSLIDFHSHPLLPSFVEAVAKQTGQSKDHVSLGGVPLPPWSVKKHLEMMDANEISVCILSLPEATHGIEGSKAKAMTRQINEDLARIISDHPTRFGAFASVPTDDMDAASEETNYALDTLKLDGVATATHTNGKYLGEAVYDSWLAELDQRGATLFVHPVAPQWFDTEKSLMNVSVIEFMFDSTRMIATMVLTGAKSKYKNIKLISTHAGGTVPFLAHRISLAGSMPWAYKDGPKLTSEQILESISTFYFDLTASTSPVTLATIKATVPVEQLVMGFDFPLMPPQTIQPAIKAFQTATCFDKHEKEKIASCNSAALVPRFAI